MGMRSPGGRCGAYPHSVLTADSARLRVRFAAGSRARCAAHSSWQAASTSARQVMPRPASQVA